MTQRRSNYHNFVLQYSCKLFFYVHSVYSLHPGSRVEAVARGKCPRSRANPQSVLTQTLSFPLITSAYPPPSHFSLIPPLQSLRSPPLPIDFPVEYSWICPHGLEWLAVKMIVHFPLPISIKVNLALKSTADAFVMLPGSRFFTLKLCRATGPCLPFGRSLQSAENPTLESCPSMS